MDKKLSLSICLLSLDAFFHKTYIIYKANTKQRSFTHEFICFKNYQYFAMENKRSSYLPTYCATLCKQMLSQLYLNTV